ncbi:hypothetical protein GRF29_96g214360 [Pseudopithomyces chartarum]|uniref:Dienelactone hydrolase domain-containing protein n=1 Tax=Pseudopithomyces chartarum TaxID=1892770 RepID=A0AAN6LV74_9PLEO|nr:hypothetical protein GRF29_96g214360 [Pseudopithomyces chartarum]
MADNDVATRAPESDAQEAPPQHVPPPAAPGQSVIPGDSIAQQGPTMGEHCTTDRPSPDGESPTGELTKLGGVDTYIAKPSDYPHSPSKLLLLLTGGTGVNSKNNQLQADKYAAEGYLVVMPDQFDNDPAPNTVQLAEAYPEKVLPILHKVVEGAKEEFADAVANGGGIYGVGYCFGAKYILVLAGEHPDTVAWGQEAPKDEEQGTVKKAPVVKAGAIAHATSVTKEDLEAVKAPVYIAAVKDDPLFPEEEILTPGRRALEKNQVDHEVQIFPGVPHGFAVYGDYEDPKIKQSQAQAYSQMLGWIQSH